MKNKIVKNALLLASLLLIPFELQAKSYVVKSPAGKLTLTVNSSERLTWKVDFAGHEIIKPSGISLKVMGGATWGNGPLSGKIEKVSRTIDGVNYHKAKIADRFTQLTLRGKGYSVEFRAYDDAAAYRFIGNSKDSLTVENEQVEYVFAGDPKAWIPYVNEQRHGERYSNSFEAYYDRSAISQMNPRKLSLLPLLVDLGGVKAAVTSIGEVDYPGMYVHAGFSKGNSLIGEFPGYPDLKNSSFGGGNTNNFNKLFRHDYIARIGGRQALPWRAVMVSEKDAGLPDNDLAQKLSRPVRLADWSWVKPGKAAWEWYTSWNVTGVDFKAGRNQETYKYFIDFAAENKLEYVVMDAGWTGKTITDYIPDLNIPELIEYGKRKGVGLIAWLSWKETKENYKKAFPVYEKWGLAGLKIDFVDANDQYVLESVKDITAFAAKHHLVIDWHGFQVNGLQVMYPNILNVEGVRGMEQCKWQPNKKDNPGADMPGYDVTIPFIRLLTAPADYTPGAMRNATKGDYRPLNRTPMSQGTRVHQMAIYSVFDAPLQMLAETPSLYKLYPLCTNFIAKVPTVFDDSKTLSGEVGKYIVTARRKGDTWFVGALTNWDEREVEIPLDFLGEGTYKAEIFQDGVNASRDAEDYKRIETTVTKGRTLKAVMKSGGGWTARFEKM